MSKPLLLSNPKDIPYGDLSPLKNNIVYDDKTNKLTNIISLAYSTLVNVTKKSIIQEIIQSPPTVAKEKALIQLTNEQNEIYLKALKHAMDVKYEQYPEACESLLDIQQEHIYYVANPPNRFLGVEIITKPDGNVFIEGDNVVGKYLKEIRRRLRIQLLEKANAEKRAFINKIYSVYKVLKNEIVNGENDLSDYLYKNADEIIEIKYLNNEVVPIINITDLLGLNSVHYKDINFFLHYPYSIAEVLRYMYANDYNEKNMNSIIKYYVDKIIRKHTHDNTHYMQMFEKTINELTEKRQLEPLGKRLIALKQMGKFEDFTFPYQLLNPSKEMFDKYQNETLSDYVIPDKHYSDVLLKNIVNVEPKPKKQYQMKKDESKRETSQYDKLIDVDDDLKFFRQLADLKKYSDEQLLHALDQLKERFNVETKLVELIKSKRDRSVQPLMLKVKQALLKIRSNYKNKQNASKLPHYLTHIDYVDIMGINETDPNHPNLASILTFYILYIFDEDKIIPNRFMKNIQPKPTSPSNLLKMLNENPPKLVEEKNQSLDRDQEQKLVLDNYFFNDENMNSPSFIQFLKIKCNDKYRNELDYLTVIHYVYATLLQSFGMDCTEAHQLLKSNVDGLSLDPNSYASIATIIYRYEHERSNYIYKVITQTSKKLLDNMYLTNVVKEFLDSNKQTRLPKPTFLMELLISSNNNYPFIVFENPDFRLGNGKDRDGNDGRNYIGDYLTFIRKILFNAYGPVKLEDIVKNKKTKQTSKKIKDILKNEEKLVFSTQRTQDLYEMMKLFCQFNKPDQSFRKQKEFSLNEAYFFIFRNYLSCIKAKSKSISIPDFNKFIIPIDFKQQFDTKDELVLANLWEYLCLNYASAEYIEANTKTNKKEYSFKNLILSARGIETTSILKKTPLFDTDQFDGLKKYRNKRTISGDDIVPVPFKQNIRDQSRTLDFPIDYNKFITTGEETEYSSLLPRDVYKVNNILQEWFKDTSSIHTIVDATAHIGVDSINFSMVFPNANIHSYELNEKTYQLLEQNVASFQKLEQIKTYNLNFLLATLPKKSSFIYIDAPWGGKSYKDVGLNEFELFLDNVNIKDISKRLLVSGHTNTVILKVPYNYHFSDLSNNFIVDRKDVNEGKKIFYVLLKLTLKPIVINQCKVKTLAITAFKNIFETLNALKTPFGLQKEKKLQVQEYKEPFILDEQTIRFAFRLMYLSNDIVNIEKGKAKLEYEEIIIPYITSRFDMENISLLASILEQCVDVISESINNFVISDVVSRILLFSNIGKLTFEQILSLTNENMIEEKEQEQELVFVAEREVMEEDDEDAEYIKDFYKNDIERGYEDEDDEDKEQEGYGDEQSEQNDNIDDDDADFN